MKRLIFAVALCVSITTVAQTVRIAAAADLRFAMGELVQSFKTNNSEAVVEVTYGSSGNFYTQIVNGAPFDIYFSADINYPQKLSDAVLTLSEPVVYGIGRIVLWSASEKVAEGMKLLAENKDLKIAIANAAHAPYGQRAVEALKYYQVYNEQQLIIGENISHAAQFCITGNADVGILALSLALSPEMAKSGTYFLIDEKSYTPLKQGFVLLNSAKDNVVAKAFAEFITLARARAIFQKYGFTLPKEL